MSNGLFEMSSDARLLIQALQGVGESEEITYLSLSGAIGRDVRKHAYSALQTARKHLEDDGILFDTVNGVGLKRMTAGDIAKGVGSRGVRSIHRMARRSIKRLSCAAHGDLTNDEAIAMNTSASVLGVLHECSKAKSVKAIEAKVQDSGAELPVGKSLELFK